MEATHTFGTQFIIRAGKKEKDKKVFGVKARQFMAYGYAKTVEIICRMTGVNDK